MAVSIIVRYMWVNRISRASLSFDILMNCSMQASTKLRARMINCALFWALECQVCRHLCLSVKNGSMVIKGKRTSQMENFLSFFLSEKQAMKSTLISIQVFTTCKAIFSWGQTSVDTVDTEPNDKRSSEQPKKMHRTIMYILQTLSPPQRPLRVMGRLGRKNQDSVLKTILASVRLVCTDVLFVYNYNFFTRFRFINLYFTGYQAY